jgi:hypothetical protein
VQRPRLVPAHSPSRYLFGVTALGVVLLTSTADAGVERPLVRNRPVASRGSDVRLISRYRARLPALPSGPLMRDEGLLDQGNYENLREYGRAIMKKFPLDRYYYVGVGRSAGAVIAFLKNVSPDIAANFPASEAGDAPEMLATHGANYHAHIEAMIPEAVRRGDRKIVLIDQSRGGSLRGIQAVFNHYRRSGRPMPEVELLTLGLKEDTLHSIDLGIEYWKNRDAVAEFIGERRDQGHIIHTDEGGLSSLTRNPNFAEHRRRMLGRMRRDADLDAFLRQSFPQLTR